MGTMVLTSLILLSCGKALPEIEGMDLSAWRHDKNGCSQIRSESMEKLSDQKDKLLALSEMDIVKLLGRPDVNELSDRNQKLYYYYLEAGSHCPGGDTTAEARRLAIRFNAMGLAKEVRFEEHYAADNSVQP